MSQTNTLPKKKTYKVPKSLNKFDGFRAGGESQS